MVGDLFRRLLTGMDDVLAGSLEASTRSARATAFSQWSVFCELHGIESQRVGADPSEAVVAAAFVSGKRFLWAIARG